MNSFLHAPCVATYFCFVLWLFYPCQLPCRYDITAQRRPTCSLWLALELRLRLRPNLCAHRFFDGCKYLHCCVECPYAYGKKVKTCNLCHAYDFQPLPKLNWHTSCEQVLQVFAAFVLSTSFGCTLHHSSKCVGHTLPNMFLAPCIKPLQMFLHRITVNWLLRFLLDLELLQRP